MENKMSKPKLAVLIAAIVYAVVQIVNLFVSLDFEYFFRSSGLTQLCSSLIYAGFAAVVIYGILKKNDAFYTAGLFLFLPILVSAPTNAVSSLNQAISYTFYQDMIEGHVFEGLSYLVPCAGYVFLTIAGLLWYLNKFFGKDLKVKTAKLCAMIAVAAFALNIVLSFICLLAVDYYPAGAFVNSFLPCAIAVMLTGAFFDTTAAKG